MTPPGPARPEHARCGAATSLTVQTQRTTQLVDVTTLVRDAVVGATGDMVTLFVPHTTAGLVLQARAPARSRPDVEAAFERLVVEDWNWKHTEEGDRNPWSHVRSALTASSVTIPLLDGDLAREPSGGLPVRVRRPRSRTLIVTVH